eukprot:GHUV01029122.1.p1 GENE.GHUV01029122.1~~GHUV01029122.1.p1  ORF type:complete len:195 (+),score=63.59 GHUV01029122.1:814-1398(+)
MPKLSDYLQREAAATAASAPLTSQFARVEGPGTAPSDAAVTNSKDAAVVAEIERLRRAHNNRLRDHGTRMYRQPDGSLFPTPPPADPYTVANRKRWSGLVKHCRRQPGVDQQLERTGVAAHYNVGVTYEQHATALKAIGLTPESDSSGSWHGYDGSLHDQLSGAAAASHPLADEQWRDITHSSEGGRCRVPLEQ